MSDNYPDKAQVDTYGFCAFGINLSSRHALAWELAELLSFADLVARNGKAKWIESVSYDSNANLCSFELAPGISFYSQNGEFLKELASKTLSQFEWPQGVIYHGDTPHNRELGVF